MDSIATYFDRHKRVVPVIALPALEMALPLADALAAGGVGVLEITLRTPCALDAIRLLSRERPDLPIGAGTVKSPAQLEHVIAAGARFAVSPGFDPAMVKLAKQTGVPLIPGVMTPSELMQAEKAGVSVVKLFPAALAGGTAFIDAMKAVFPDIRFFPTGGISEQTAGDYLARDNVLCIGGSWLTPAGVLLQRDWNQVRELASRC